MKRTDQQILKEFDKQFVLTDEVFTYYEVLEFIKKILNERKI